MKISPCMYCTRVEDPRKCEDKNCRAWRAWFVERWESLRAVPRARMEQVTPQPAGVCIGGNYYSQPHRVQGYLQTDPCDKCLCPRTLCTTPCRLKRSWQQARQDVFL